MLKDYAKFSRDSSVKKLTRPDLVVTVLLAMVAQLGTCYEKASKVDAQQAAYVESLSTLAELCD